MRQDFPSTPRRNRALRAVPLVLVACCCTCNRAASRSPMLVFSAGALGKPLKAALSDFFHDSTGRAELELAGSLETVRKITDLGRRPDAVALADTGLFGKLLAGIAGAVAPLGRSSMVLAYTRRSRFATQINPDDWTQVITRPGVEVGRSDPALDPAGYRALFVFQLAERYYRERGLARRLEAAAPARNMRPKSADLVALLQTGNLDYAWEYESVARSAGLSFIRLRPEIDLGDPALAQLYATATVRVPGSMRANSAGRDSVVIRGAPIVFGIASVRRATHETLAKRFIRFLNSREGQRILSGYHMESVNAAPAADTSR